MDTLNIRTVAQRLELYSYKVMVPGSNPGGPTIYIPNDKEKLQYIQKVLDSCRTWEQIESYNQWIYRIGKDLK